MVARFSRSFTIEGKKLNRIIVHGPSVSVEFPGDSENTYTKGIVRMDRIDNDPYQGEHPELAFYKYTITVNGAGNVNEWSIYTPGYFPVTTDDDELVPLKLYAWTNSNVGTVYTSSSTPSSGEKYCKSNGIEYKSYELNDGTYSYQNTITSVSSGTIILTGDPA